MSNEELVALIQAGRCDLMPKLWDNVIGLVKKLAYKLYIALEASGTANIPGMKVYSRNRKSRKRSAR